MYNYKALLLALSVVSSAYAAAAADGRVNVQDSAGFNGQGASAVFVYDTGGEAPPATCAPEVVNIKAANGSTISTTTVCEKINLASNPNRFFVVAGRCLGVSPSTLAEACGATNTTTNWMNVSLEIKPELDGNTESNWASIFCKNCSWIWQPTANTCSSSTNTMSGRLLQHNFTGNPSGFCTSSGTFAVTDPETGKTWTSQPVTGTLRPSAPPRNFTLTHVASAGSNTSFYSASSAETTATLGSLTFSPRLNGKDPSRWGPDLNCPRCQYSRINVSTSCAIGSPTSFSTSATLNTSSAQSCSYGYAYTINDPDTGWSARFPSSGTVTYTIRKKPIPCVGSSTTRWVSASSSCPSGSTGSITYEAEQSQSAVCPGPTYTPWVNTGNKRNTVNNCTLTNPPPTIPPFWENIVAGCFVDTDEYDRATVGSCGSGGVRTMNAASISFTVGDNRMGPTWSMSQPGVSISWTGDCVSSAETCGLRKECSYIGGRTRCLALGPKRATVTVRYQGLTKTFEVLASDYTVEHGSGPVE